MLPVSSSDHHLPPSKICKKSFKRPQDLKKHEKIHTEEHHQQHKHSKAITVVDPAYVSRVRGDSAVRNLDPKQQDIKPLQRNSAPRAPSAASDGAFHSFVCVAPCRTANLTPNEPYTNSPPFCSLTHALPRIRPPFRPPPSPPDGLTPRPLHSATASPAQPCLGLASFRFHRFKAWSRLRCRRLLHRYEETPCQSLV